MAIFNSKLLNYQRVKVTHHAAWDFHRGMIPSMLQSSFKMRWVEVSVSRPSVLPFFFNLVVVMI